MAGLFRLFVQEKPFPKFYPNPRSMIVTLYLRASWLLIEFSRVALYFVINSKFPRHLVKHDIQ